MQPTSIALKSFVKIFHLSVACARVPATYTLAQEIPKAAKKIMNSIQKQTFSLPTF